MIKETYHEEDDRLIINRVQDVSGILDFVKEAGEQMQHDRGDFRYAGAVPDVVMEQWMRECGAKLGSQELMAYIKTKMMDGEFAKLRARGF